MQLSDGFKPTCNSRANKHQNTVWREIFAGQNFRGFRGLPNIRENFIRELGVLAVLSRDSGQHPRKFYLRIFILGAIRENFVPRKFPAIRYLPNK